MKYPTFKLMLISLCLFMPINSSAQELQPAPDFVLDEFSTKQKIVLSNLLDGKKVVVISFFNTQCEPCKKELPILKSVIKECGDISKIFLVNIDERPRDVLPAYIKQYELETIPILIDPLGYRCAEKYGVCKYGQAEIPQLFVIGKDGKIELHIKKYQENLKEILTNKIKELAQKKVEPIQKKELALIYTNSANGYLESCDCPANPFGGLVRRVTMLKKLKSANPNNIVLDSGDFLPPRYNKSLSDCCVKLMQLCDYDAVGIGDQELIGGSEMITGYLDKLPFYSANLQVCDAEKCYPISESHLVREFGAVKIAIISVVDKNVFKLFPKSKLVNIKFLDHREYLKQIVPELRKETDVIIVLSHCGDDEDRVLAESVPGIDIIIGGHSQTLHKQPLKIGTTLIVQAGENGHNIGKLVLEFGKDKRIMNYTNELITLDKTVTDDAKARELITEYTSSLKKPVK